MSQDIFVIIEHLQGQVLEISYIMLAGARQLSQRLGGGVTAVLFGQNAHGLAGNLQLIKCFTWIMPPWPSLHQMLIKPVSPG